MDSSSMSTLQSLAPFGLRTAEDLAKEVGPAFLLLVCELRPPKGPMRTADADAAVDRTFDLATYALPMRRKPTSDMPFISIGRLAGNDIAIADVTVSKFHAFVREVNGRFMLLDADSRNGTFVDEVKVATRKAGEPVALRQGASVRFGSMQCSFVDAAGLHSLLRRVVANP